MLDQEPTTLYIKNMVCDRCKQAVTQILETIPQVQPKEISLGVVTLKAPINQDTLSIIQDQLEKQGFELINNRTSKLIEEIKRLLIGEIHQQKQHKKESENFSDFLERLLQYDYSYLNELFASIEGRTIGQYIILLKVEKAKELLIYDELSLSDIARQLQYSSPQYLSAQFKQLTGLTPSHFKKIGQNKRNSLDAL
ncbi:MAG: helix-turn-helix domain-containing protein [Cyclobacteriaceae bacterium]